MNPIINAASANSELGWLMGITTVLFVATFAFWTWWAYASKNKARWEADSRLPLNDGGDS
jgi:cbb3-type cytochrome oxidase subunit 3